jgi:hypothetical protein
MATIRWTDTSGWHDARVEPYGPLTLDPSELSGSIPPGIIRESLLSLARDLGIRVTERRVPDHHPAARAARRNPGRAHPRPEQLDAAAGRRVGGRLTARRRPASGMIAITAPRPRWKTRRPHRTRQRRSYTGPTSPSGLLFVQQPRTHPYLSIVRPNVEVRAGTRRRAVHHLGFWRLQFAWTGLWRHGRARVDGQIDGQVSPMWIICISIVDNPRSVDLFGRARARGEVIR